MKQIKNQDVATLIHWLNRYRPALKPYAAKETRRYFRIVNGQNAAHCFVARENFETKGLGIVRTGDLLMPASYQRPTKHARGNLFDRSTWSRAFETQGMRRLRA